MMRTAVMRVMTVYTSEFANWLKIWIAYKCIVYECTKLSVYMKRYLHLAVERMFKHHQSNLLNDIKAQGEELVLGGDGHCDSPGHSAKHSCYTLMNLEHKLFSRFVLVSNYSIYKQMLYSKQKPSDLLSLLTQKNSDHFSFCCGINLNHILYISHICTCQYIYHYFYV